MGEKVWKKILKNTRSDFLVDFQAVYKNHVYYLPIMKENANIFKKETEGQILIWKSDIHLHFSLNTLPNRASHMLSKPQYHYRRFSNHITSTHSLLSFRTPLPPVH